MFQAYNLIQEFSVEDNITLPLRFDKNKDRETFREVVEALGLKDKLKRRPMALSGGEQQRVAIARALAGGAKIILADEPTGNLDEENGAVVVSILQRLAHEDGYCVIVVTHDMGIADKADEVIRLSDGRIVSSESAADVG